MHLDAIAVDAIDAAVARHRLNPRQLFRTRADHHFESRQSLAKRLRRFLPERPEVEVRRTDERLVEDRQLVNARDAIAADVVRDRGDEIPDASLRDESERIDDALARVLAVQHADA